MSVNTYSDHYFIFGGVDSRTYGMVVSNDNGFDAPERDVKEVEIPGRNGSLVLDNGRYKNQTLTNPGSTPRWTPSGRLCVPRGAISALLTLSIRAYTEWAG